MQNGPLPLALRAFYEIVGAINFVGTPFERPNWPGIEDGLDPLYIAGVENVFQQDGTLGVWPREVFIPPDYLDSYFVSVIIIAPDDLHKYYISGAGPISIEVPSRDADTPLIGVPFIPDNSQITDGDVTLVRYLRYALRGGGFLAFPPVRAREQVPEADLAYLTDGLEPI